MNELQIFYDHNQLQFQSPDSLSNNSYLKIHNLGSSVSEFYELHVPYMMMYESYQPETDLNTIINISPVNCNRTVFPRGSIQFSKQRSLHQHDFFELMIVLSGSVSQRIEDQTFCYTAGQACLLNRNIRHCEDFSSDFEIVFLMLTDEILNHMLEHDILYTPQGNIHNCYGSIYQLIEQNQRTKYYTAKSYIDFFPCKTLNENSPLMIQMHTLINQLTEEISGQQPGCIFFIEGLLSRLFSLFEDNTLYEKKQFTFTGSTDEALLNKIGHIFETRKGRVTRAELESLTNYNGDYMNRIIKKYTGQTMTEYGLNFTLKEAQKLLLDSDKSISEIISELKFSNRSYFYRIFNKKYGMTPKEYREKNGQTSIWQQIR